MWHSSTTMRWHNCLAENLHSIAYFFKFKFASKKSSSENNKLVFHFSNQQRHIVLCWHNDRRILSSFISCICFNIRTFISHLFCLGFPKSQVAKLRQCLSTREAVLNSCIHLFIFDWGNVGISLNRILI